MVRVAACLVVLPLVLAACDAGGTTAPEESFPIGNAVLGRHAFSQECATCHASGDGMDLAFFGFTDTTIVRRAVAHVDTATALDIVAHIRSLGVRSVGRDARVFQPGGATVASDVAFAVGVFGADAFPADMTTARMAAIDTRAVRVALPMPAWSDEQRNIDWMPDAPLPDAILDFQGGLVRAAVAGYQAAPTAANLTRAVQALRVADRHPSNAAAPCQFDDAARVNYRQCFEVRRWTSTLVAQHMIRFDVDRLDAVSHDVWWDVGNAARKSRTVDAGRIDNAEVNWASWMVLGWSFDPARHPSVYTGGGLRALGLHRHATFVAVRSEVARPHASAAPYEDARQAIRFAPDAWTYDVATFALGHLLERLQAGDVPARADQLARADEEVRMALAGALRRVPAERRAALSALAAAVLDALPDA